MSVMLEFSNVIVRRDSIENKYPGGWDEWKKNHQFWYDDHLYRTGSMGDDSHIEEELKSYGMVGICEDPEGKQFWKDYCIITTGPKVELLYGECDWVEIDVESWTVKMAGVPDSKQRYTSEPERKWRLGLMPGRGIISSATGKIETFNVHVFERNDDKKILSSHSAQIMIVDENYKILSCCRLMRGDVLEFDDGEIVSEGQELVSSDPYNQAIFAEASGVVAFENLLEGKNLKTTHCEATGLTWREVIDSDQPNLEKAKVAITSTNGEAKLYSDGSPIIYTLPVGCSISCSEGENVQPGDVIARIPVSDAHYY